VARPARGIGGGGGGWLRARATVPGGGGGDGGRLGARAVASGGGSGRGDGGVLAFRNETKGEGKRSANGFEAQVYSSVN
jgi:hypothetical protein